MDRNSFCKQYRDNVMQNGILNIEDFAAQAAGRQAPKSFNLDEASNWERPTKERNFQALSWLATNWNYTDDLTILFPGKVFILAPITFNENCRFTLTGMYAETSIDIDTAASAFGNTNSDYKDGDRLSALTFRRQCDLSNLSFGRTDDKADTINIIRIDTIDTGSVIKNCGIEGFGGRFAITVKKGGLRVEGCNFKNSPNGTCIRFMNADRNRSYDLYVGGNSLFHFGKSAKAVTLGQTDKSVSSTKNVGNVIIESNTLDIGGNIIDGIFDDKSRVESLTIQNNNMSGTVKNISDEDTEFVIGIQKNSGKVTFGSISIIDNIITATKAKNTSLAVIYIPDKISVDTTLKIKGVFTTEKDPQTYPIIISSNIVNSKLSVCGIVTNYTDETKSGVGGIAKRKKNGQLVPLQNFDEDNFNDATIEVAG